MAVALGPLGALISSTTGVLMSSTALASGGVTSPTSPTFPYLPKSSGRTLAVGPGQAYATLAAAVAASAAGDTINVAAGTYTNDFTTITHDLTVQATGGQANFVATVAPPNGKALLDVSGNVLLKNLTLSGVLNADGNGAGVRYEGGNLSLQYCILHDNQNGILGNVDPNGTVYVDSCEFYGNGNAAGSAHNMYIGAIKQFSLTNSYSHDVTNGHLVKSRAANTTLSNNRLFDNASNSSYSIDLPNGGNAAITGNVIQQGANAGNPIMIAYAEENGAYGTPNPGTSVTVSNNTFVNDLANGSAVLTNAMAGAVVTGSGNTAWGLTAQQLGAFSGLGVTGLSARPTLSTASPVTSTAPTATGSLTVTAGGVAPGGTISGISYADANAASLSYTVTAPSAPESGHTVLTGASGTLPSIANAVAGPYTFTLYNGTAVLGTASVTVAAPPATGSAPWLDDSMFPGLPVHLDLSVQQAGAQPFASHWHGFKQGDVPAGSRVALTLANGTALTVQQDQESHYADGSLRSCVLRYRLPGSYAALGAEAGIAVSAASGAPNRGGAITPAQIAAAHDFKVRVSGGNFAPDTFTVALNDILATQPGWSTSTGWGANSPLGGYRIVASGPVATVLHAWRFLRRDSDGAAHQRVRVDLFVQVYQDGAGTIVYADMGAIPMQPNAYGAVAGGTVGGAPTGTSRTYTGAFEVYDGSTLKFAMGGPNDPRAVTGDQGMWDTANSVFSTSAGFAHYQSAGVPIGFSGPGVPAALAGAGASYWTTGWGPGTQGAGLATSRGDASTYAPGQNQPNWSAGASVSQGSELRMPDGSIWVVTTSGTLGGSPPTGAGQATNGTAVLYPQVVSFGAAGSGAAKVFPLCYVKPGSMTPVMLGNGDPVPLVGANPQVWPRWDLAYLTRKARFLPPWDLSLTSDLISDTVAGNVGAPGSYYYGSYQPNRQSSLTESGSADSNDIRIGNMPTAMGQLFYRHDDPKRDVAVKAAALNIADFPLAFLDERTGLPVQVTTGSVPGMIANTGLYLFPGHSSGSPVYENPNYDMIYGTYGPLVDYSHLQDVWVSPYMRTGNPIWADLGMMQFSVAMASIGTGRTPTYNGSTYDIPLSDPGQGQSTQAMRACGWSMRALHYTRHVLEDTHPSKPVVNHVYENTANMARDYAANAQPAANTLGWVSLIGATNDLAMDFRRGDGSEQAWAPEPFFPGYYLQGMMSLAWHTRDGRFANQIALAAKTHVDAYDNGYDYYVNQYHYPLYRHMTDPDSAMFQSYQEMWSYYMGNPATTGSNYSLNQPVQPAGFNDGQHYNGTAVPGEWTAEGGRRRCVIHWLTWFSDLSPRAPYVAAALDARLAAAPNTGGGIAYHGPESGMSINCYPNESMVGPGQPNTLTPYVVH